MNINFELFLQSLVMAAKGFLGIFVVTAIIILSVFLLNFFGSRKKKDKDE